MRSPSHGEPAEGTAAMSGGPCRDHFANLVTCGCRPTWIESMNHQSPTIALSRIGQIAITVHDLDRAVAFYQSTLGMKLLFRVPNMAFFDCGGVRLMLTLLEKSEFDHPASVIYYKVADLPATHTALLAQNVNFDAPPHLIAKMPDHDLWMAFLRDSEGNLLGLMSEVKRGGTT
jgi:methylmalonyl-CoA/ethylmalonyl-CoA epimerase